MENVKILGAGFSCIDLIKWENNLYTSLGGTAANVLTILSQLGFDTKLLTVEYVGENDGWYKNALQVRNITPIYFQKSSKNISMVVEDVDNYNNHVFKTVCPNCKNSLVKVILPSNQNIENVSEQIGKYDLFFYDRFSSGINCIANKNIKGWNMYEPNAFRMYSNLLNGCEVADIIKFSSTRIPDKICEQLLLDLKNTRAQIIIVTMGQEGLKFSVKQNGDWSRWKHLSSIDGKSILDTAGAGDWLTAGFLFELLSNYREVQSFSHVKLMEILKKARLLATTACGFIGAQGILKETNGIEQLKMITGKNFGIIQDKDIGEKIVCSICGFNVG